MTYLKKSLSVSRAARALRQQVRTDPNRGFQFRLFLIINGNLRRIECSIRRGLSFTIFKNRNWKPPLGSVRTCWLRAPFALTLVAVRNSVNCWCNVSKLRFCSSQTLSLSLSNVWLKKQVVSKGKCLGPSPAQRCKAIKFSWNHTLFFQMYFFLYISPLERCKQYWKKKIGILERDKTSSEDEP